MSELYSQVNTQFGEIPGYFRYLIKNPKSLKGPLKKDPVCKLSFVELLLDSFFVFKIMKNGLT